MFGEYGSRYSLPPDYECLVIIMCLSKHEEEPPQNMKPGAAGEKQISKAALKNQKKREAKKAAKQVHQSWVFAFVQSTVKKNK